MGTIDLEGEMSKQVEEAGTIAGKGVGCNFIRQETQKILTNYQNVNPGVVSVSKTKSTPSLDRCGKTEAEGEESRRKHRTDVQPKATAPLLAAEGSLRRSVEIHTALGLPA